MDRVNAIETLRANYPDACFEQLREAVDVAIEALKAQLSQEGKTSDTISRQQAIDVVDSETVSTNPEHFKSSEKFIKFMDDADIASFGKWQFANGFNTALVASKLQLEKLLPAQPEPIKINIEDFNKEDWERLKKEWENTPVTVLPAQPEERTEKRTETHVCDLISRQAAIDALQNCRKHCIDPFDSYHIDIQDAEYQLSKVTTIQPEPKWIPVSEMMPEDYVDVLVWFEYYRYGDYNCMYATHGIGNYSKEYNSWTINHETGWKDLHVFAWMPLPEPYRKGADK